MQWVQDDLTSINKKLFVFRILTLLFIEVRQSQFSKVSNQRPGIEGGGLRVNGHCSQVKVDTLEEEKLVYVN